MLLWAWLNFIWEETLLLSMKLTNDIINYRFLSTETNSKALYIFPYFLTTSSVMLFVVTVQIIEYKFLFIIVFLEKVKTTLIKPFTFWKWKKISKNNHILEMKAHSETHFENENMFSENWKVINLFFKKLQLGKSIKKGSRVFLVPNSIDWCFLTQSSSLLSLKKLLFLRVTSSRIIGNMSNCECIGNKSNCEPTLAAMLALTFKLHYSKVFFVLYFL